MGIERAPSALSRNHVLARAYLYKEFKSWSLVQDSLLGLGLTDMGQLIWYTRSRITAVSGEDIVLGVVYSNQKHVFENLASDLFTQQKRF